MAVRYIHGTPGNVTSFGGDPGDPGYLEMNTDPRRGGRFTHDVVVENDTSMESRYGVPPVAPGLMSLLNQVGGVTAHPWDAVHGAGDAIFTDAHAILANNVNRWTGSSVPWFRDWATATREAVMGRNAMMVAGGRDPNAYAGGGFGAFFIPVVGPAMMANDVAGAVTSDVVGVLNDQDTGASGAMLATLGEFSTADKLQKMAGGSPWGRFLGTLMRVDALTGHGFTHGPNDDIDRQIHATQVAQLVTHMRNEDIMKESSALRDVASMVFFGEIPDPTGGKPTIQGSRKLASLETAVKTMPNYRELVKAFGDSYDKFIATPEGLARIRDTSIQNTYNSFTYKSPEQAEYARKMLERLYDGDDTTDGEFRTRYAGILKTLDANRLTKERYVRYALFDQWAGQSMDKLRVLGQRVRQDMDIESTVQAARDPFAFGQTDNW